MRPTSQGTDLKARIEAETDAAVVALAPMGGGHGAALHAVDLDDGRRLVAKSGTGLEPEGFCLSYLARATVCPVPQLLRADDDLLLMTRIDGTTGADGKDAQRDLARVLAELHTIVGPRYGFARPTPHAGFLQPNDWDRNWHCFYGERRLKFVARSIDTSLALRVEKLVARLPDLLPRPKAPGLIHGDLWGGNIISRDGRIAALVDPSLYFADPEIEIAFLTLFGDVGDDFFAAYDERRKLSPDFHETRRDLYCLWHLLVHLKLFGASYRGQVDAILNRFV
jgi:fructosamine-3-kinase